MAKPTVKVEVAWTDGPYVASPTWSDITTYVRSVSTRRGRTDDWQNFDSGSATIVLDNRDRRFDPTYTTGPNYGNLLPRRQIRVTADAGTGGGYVALFRGYVDGWPVKLSQAGFDSTVTITAYEVLGLIAQDQVPADWSDDYIVSLSPSRYWKLDEVINPSQIPTTAGTLTNLKLKDYGTDNIPLSPISVSIPTASTTLNVPGVTSNGLTWAQGNRYGTDAYEPNLVQNTAAGGGCLWFIPSGFESLWTVRYGRLAAPLHIIYAAYSPTTSTFYIDSYNGTSPLQRYSANIQLTLGVPHHFAFRYTGSGSTFSPNVYIDGVELTLTGSTPGGTMSGISGFEWYGLTGQQIVAWRDAAPTAAQLLTIYQLGNNVLTETTAARFSRVIAQTPLPAALYSCTASPAGTVGRLTVGGAYVNNELQLDNDSEGGELYTTKAGVLTMTNRTWYQTGTSATSQATFGSGGIPIQTEIDYAWNADNIRNTLDVSWSGDAVVTCTNTSSRTTYGVMQDSWTTALSTYADAQTLGNLLVNFGGLPRLVISAVEVGQALSGANWSTVLGLELLDRITVVVPEPVGSNLTQTQIIQQIEHEITPGDWTTRILGSARWSSVFTIGTSYLDGTDILG